MDGDAFGFGMQAFSVPNIDDLHRANLFDQFIFLVLTAVYHPIIHNVVCDLHAELGAVHESVIRGFCLMLTLLIDTGQPRRYC